MVPVSEVVVDVGSDHGYLALLLLKAQKAQRVINVEKAKGPLQAGIANAAKSRYADRIDHQLSDGFANYTGPKHVDTVVLAGFGGQTIVRIISQTSVAWKHLLVQPANNAALIRKFAHGHNYAIADEAVISDGHFYELILISKEGARTTSESDILFGPVNLKRGEKPFCDYWKQRLEHLQRISRIARTAAIAKEIGMIEQVLGSKSAPLSRDKAAMAPILK